MEAGLIEGEAPAEAEVADVQPEAEAEAQADTPKPKAKKDARAEALAARTAELVPEIKTPIRAKTARLMITVLGRRDPVAFAEIPPEALGGREPQAVLHDFARGVLAKDDVAAVALRARTRDVAKGAGDNALWGRKIAALLVGLADAKAAKQGE